VIVAALNSTVVLAAAVTGLTAVVVAVIGYLGSKLSAQSVARQTEAENERTRIQYEEAHRQKRQQVYHALLNTERGHQRLLFDRGAGEQIRAEAWGPLAGHLNAAMIFGTKEVGREAVRFAQAINAARRTGEELDTGHATPEQFDQAMRRWTATRRDLVDAMRADIATDAAAIDWPDVEQL
jgi:hypothetical protein